MPRAGPPSLFNSPVVVVVVVVVSSYLDQNPPSTLPEHATMFPQQVMPYNTTRAEILQLMVPVLMVTNL